MDYGSALDNIDMSETDMLQVRIAELEAQVEWMKERESATLVNYRPSPNRDSVTERVAELQSINLDKEERKWAEAEAEALLQESVKYAEDRERRINACPNCGV